MADNMIEVARATVTIIPNMQGAQAAISEELNAAVVPAGEDAGTTTGESMVTAIGDKLSNAGATLTKAVTIPLMAAGGAAIKAFSDVDAGVDTMIVKTGASGEALEEMEGILQNIASSVPADFGEIGSAIGEVNTRFGSTGDDLESLSTAFIKFSKLNGTDVSDSVDTVSKVMAAFGMSADDATDYLDALNVVGQQTGVNVSSLAKQVSANAAQFKQMGLTAYDAANFLGQADMAGIEASTMLMGLKMAMSNASDEGITLDQALASFTETMNGNGTETDKLSAAYDLFGTRAGAAIYNAVATGQLSLTDFQASLVGFEGSVETTFTNTLDPMDQASIALNQLKILGAELFSVVAPALTSALETLSGVLASVTAWWQSLNPATQEWIVKLILLAAALGPILIVAGQLVNSVTSIGGAIGGVIGKFTSVGTAATTAATGTASAASSFATLAGTALLLVAAGASIFLIGQAMNTMADAAIRLSEAGGGAVATFVLIAAVGVGMAAAIVAIGTAAEVSAIGLLALSVAVLAVSAGISLVITSLTAFVEQLPTLAEYGASGAEALLAVSVAILAVDAAALLLAVSIAAMGVAAAAAFLPFLGVDLTIGALDLAMAGLDITMGLLVVEMGILEAALVLVAGSLEDIKNDASEAATSLEEITDSVSIIEEGMNAIGDAIGGLISAIVDALDGAEPDAVASATALATGIVTAIDTGLNPSANDKVTTAMNNIVSTLTTGASRARTSATQIGQSIVQGITTGMASLNAILNNAYYQVVNMCNAMRNAFASTSFRFNSYIPLPHFYLSGTFDAKSGSVPSVGVSWYARAAEQGARFTTPTIIGVGDAAQPEILIGEDKLKELVRGSQPITVNVYGSEGMNVRQLADAVAQRLTHVMNSKEAVYA